MMRLLAAEPRSTAGLLCPSVFQRNDLADPIFDIVGLEGFKSRANAVLLADAFLSSTVPFLFFFL